MRFVCCKQSTNVSFLFTLLTKTRINDRFSTAEYVWYAKVKTTVESLRNGGKLSLWVREVSIRLKASISKNVCKRNECILIIDIGPATEPFQHPK